MKKHYEHLFFLITFPVLAGFIEQFKFNPFGSYSLPLHNFLEIVSIILCIKIFGIGWLSRKRINSGAMILLSCIFFSVGMLDFLHMLSYDGMPDFITENTPDKSIYFWFSARFVAVFGLLALGAILFFNNKETTAKNSHLILFLTTIYVVLLSYFIIYQADYLPELFNYGSGTTILTTFIEGTISLIGMLAAFFLYQKREQKVSLNIYFLIQSALLMGATELFFVNYTDTNDLMNLYGHLYKILAYFFFYQAVVLYAIELPYQQLENVNNDLDLSITASNTGLWSWNVTTNEVKFSEIFKQQLGYEDIKLVKHFSTIEEMVHPDDKSNFMNLINEYINSKNNNRFECEYRLKKNDGSYCHIILNGIKKYNSQDGSVTFLGAHVDITERKEQEHHIKQLANFDPLTGLPNRNSLHTFFDELLMKAQQEHHFISLMFIDLDHFKNINDTLGHSAGDELLIEVGARLSNAIGKDNFVSRIGGDEFVVAISSNETTNEKTHLTKVKNIAESILQVLSQPYEIDTNRFSLTPSIGIATYPTNGTTFSDLSRYADMAMYEVKEGGRNNYYFFNDEIHKKITRHLQIRNSIESSIENNEFHLFFQPQFDIKDLSSPKLIGFETLIRWNHQELGKISPAEFIPIAESSGLILPLGNWLIKNVCYQISEWQVKYENMPSISLNISPVQFTQKNLAQFIKNHLDEYGINPHLLRFELTEGTMMKRPEQTKEIINQLGQMGILLEIDDFGTGYSSLSYLKEFDVYKLKIDRSFVKNINIKEADSSIIKTIIEMCKNLGFKVIAEGVEDQVQLNFLHENGCYEIQGYIFSEPLSPPLAEELIKEINQ